MIGKIILIIILFISSHTPKFHHSQHQLYHQHFNKINHRIKQKYHHLQQPQYSQVFQSYVTAYTDRGTTANGWQAGPGICAVDPRIIAFGSHLHIVGKYVLDCIAEDTGGLITGTRIDVWVPTDSQAYEITGWYTTYVWR